MAPPTIAATSTFAMVRAAAVRGIPTEDLLADAGITVAVLEDPDTRLPYRQVMGIWNALRERSADRALQLAAPLTLPWGTYRIIDYLVAASATVGAGVERFARFFALIADAVTLSIGRDRGSRYLAIQLADGGAVPPMYVDYVFAALVSRIRLRIRPELALLRVELRQPEPAAPAPYAELFQAPVRFGAPADRLYFSEAEWQAPVASADAALARLLEEHAGIIVRSRPHAVPTFVSDVERALAVALPQGGSADVVARVLHVSVRTLQRKLVATGTTFREVSARARARLAEEYLADPKVGIAEVAFLLGFSDQSSFNRAFRRWTGMSPGRWRKRMR